MGGRPAYRLGTTRRHAGIALAPWPQGRNHARWRRAARCAPVPLAVGGPRAARAVGDLRLRAGRFRACRHRHLVAPQNRATAGHSRVAATRLVHVHVRGAPVDRRALGLPTPRRCSPWAVGRRGVGGAEGQPGVLGVSDRANRLPPGMAGRRPRRRVDPRVVADVVAVFRAPRKRDPGLRGDIPGGAVPCGGTPAAAVVVALRAGGVGECAGFVRVRADPAGHVLVRSLGADGPHPRVVPAFDPGDVAGVPGVLRQPVQIRQSAAGDANRANRHRHRVPQIDRRAEAGADLPDGRRLADQRLRLAAVGLDGERRGRG